MTLEQIKSVPGVDGGESPLAERFAGWATQLRAQDLPADLRHTLQLTVLDAHGLMVAARRTDYVAAALAAVEADGPCSMVGHKRPVTASEAALISGMAAHGEDFDDTFEGTPVHIGAVVVPAVLAAAEARGLSGADILRGLAVGAELSCRLAVVAPTAIHRAGFHLTAVIGAMGAAAGVSAALGLAARRMASALGVAGSMASGIIEYLAEGTWTKRLHPGWAAQSGIRAARLAEAGFLGPRTVLDGLHGFFKAFADPAIPREFGAVTHDLGRQWQASRLAFKPYACGTMIQPYIDCAIKLRREGVTPDQIAHVTARVSEGIVHRLCEPRAEKIAPSTPYSAKFSIAFGVALGFVEGAAGLGHFTEAGIADRRLLELTPRIDHEIDPDNEYPGNYTGELIVTLRDGRELRARQPHMRGGRREPLSDEEMLAKFHANTAFGGWSRELSERLAEFSLGLFDAPDMSAMQQFRQ